MDKRHKNRRNQALIAGAYAQSLAEGDLINFPGGPSDEDEEKAERFMFATSRARSTGFFAASQHLYDDLMGEGIDEAEAIEIMKSIMEKMLNL